MIGSCSIAALTSVDPACRQRDDIEDERGGVVGAAGLERRRDQRAGGILGSRALAHDVGDGLFRQKPVHAVAAQQKTVMQGDRLGRVVQAHFGLDPERAGQNVRAGGAVLAHVVGGEAAEAVAAEAIGAGVPGVQEVGDAAAQHQCRERAAHPGKLRVLATERVHPAVERADDPGAGPLHLHGLGQIAKPVEEAAHRGLGGDAATLRAADAVGDRGDHFRARLGQLRADHGAGEILVVLARPGLRGEADARLGTDLNRRHGGDRAELRSARPLTERRPRRPSRVAARHPRRDFYRRHRPCRKYPARSVRLVQLYPLHPAQLNKMGFWHILIQLAG